MEIVSEIGVPMTNGEVYALVRRRRDERNAAQHPPFCQQLQQADSHSRASSQYLASKFSSAAATARGGQPGALSSAARGVLSAHDTANAANAVLATPAAGHLVILLTEVKLLNYLAHHSHLTANARIGSVYGPASVYEAVIEKREAQDGVGGDAEGEGAHVSTSGMDTVDGNGAPSPASRRHQDHANDKKKKKSCGSSSSNNKESDFAARDAVYCERVQSSQPGTVAHVAAVDAWLHLHETRGQAQETLWATAVQRSLAVGKHTSSSALPTAGLSSCADTGEEKLGGASSSKPLSSYRVLLSAPTMLSLDEPLPATTTTNRSVVKTELLTEDAVNETKPQLQTDSHTPPSSIHLTSDELLRLVVARPQSALDVYRLVDHLEERFDYQEAALTGWCNALKAVFSQRV